MQVQEYSVHAKFKNLIKNLFLLNDLITRDCFLHSWRC